MLRSRWVRVALLLFVLYFVAVYPTEAAEITRDTVSGALDVAGTVAESMSDFVRGLV